MKVKTIITLAVMMTASFCSASTNNNISLAGRHQMTFSAGAVTEDSYDDFDPAGIGTIEYSYWLSDSVAFNIKASCIGLDADNYAHGYIEDVEIEPLLVGFEFRPEFFNVTKNSFFSLNASFGPHVGVFEKGRLDDDCRCYRNKDREITEYGGYIGGKFTVVLNSGVTLGAFAGFHFISEFNTPKQGDKDFSTADIGLSIGYLF